ncbi:zinc metalloprotease [Knoellia aerolata]|uniref:Peptidase n=1 Tax=Knoellia aerolata DSM 18566 TaxID=1385519 RepID=A0A0A0JT17_9MICO|nr:zinc metalloprotease [Knoellia aerolata]KGN40313.1 peptidase [Knoellia aerolata DSM 18566]
MTRRLIRPALGAIALTAATLAMSVPASVSATSAPSPAVAECDPATGTTSAARVRDDAKGVKEPELYSKNEANAYGVLKDSPLMAAGSVTIPTVFHVVSKEALSGAAETRMSTMIDAQMTVLNDAFAGTTAPDAADSPFRFELEATTHTVNPTWNTVVPGKVERDMKKALHQGDSRTLNVYVADIGGGLLGWAYFPKGVDNNGRSYIDGVVMLDESMPGGTAGKYALGDTLVHEVGHWMMLEHTFAHGCSASGDWVADTPREAVPQFNCPTGADTCTAPGLDPIHNFMDYTQDSCMNMFTPGQVERMNDAWVAFRA